MRATHRKSALPNYKVFDEKRYSSLAVSYRGGLPRVPHRNPRVRRHLVPGTRTTRAIRGGAEMFVVLNASPFEIHKQTQSRGHRPAAA